MKISVIVPVFNSEEYVSRCIDSIIAQTYKNWELILIDDGSTDNSLSIINEYVDVDRRIKCFSQKNQGPGVARNLGLLKATGDYIVFVDSDDFIEPNYFSLLSEKKEDVVFIDVNQVDENFNLLKTEHLSDYKKLTKDQFIRRQMTGMIPWGGVRKAVKKCLLDNNNIKYSNLQIGEEAIYSFLIMYYSSSFSFIEIPVYSYVIRGDSQSHMKLDNPWGAVVDNLKLTLSNMNIYSQFENTLNAFSLVSSIISLHHMAYNYSYHDYKLMAYNTINDFFNKKNRNSKIDFLNIKKLYVFLYPLFRFRCVLFFYIISHFKKG